jgi:hypothetical protein
MRKHDLLHVAGIDAQGAEPRANLVLQAASSNRVVQEDAGTTRPIIRKYARSHAAGMLSRGEYGPGA